MPLTTTTIDYYDRDTLLQGYLAFDSTVEESRPVVLIAHAWGGRDDFVEAKARSLAEMGYIGFALDMYGKGVLGRSLDENAQLMQPFMENRALLQQRIGAALNTVNQLPFVNNDKIAAIGFCFGGLCVLDLARTGAPIQGVVSFHGLLLPAKNIPHPEVSAKILVLHGHDDPMVSSDQVIELQHELTRSGADWQLHQYGNTMHAFTNPLANDPDFGTVYQRNADYRSWLSMQHFLAELFA
ncbi:MAG: dienelactone hydrolase family protein [Methylococcales bacterium]|nr:dienelactone hydrolase family protein [Methylococcales bacterium]